VRLVASFDLDAVTTHPIDFRLVAGGGAALFLRESVLLEAQEALASMRYAIVPLDASEWTEESALHEALSAGLGFPAYYGRNLDALNDCLGDVARGDYGWSASTTTGLVVVVRGFAAFARRDPVLARHVAEAFIGTTRGALLFGHRIMWLLHVDEPDFRLDLDARTYLPWNGREWLSANRR
jgi:hypothetical protein